jgi:hypothetical protein
MNALPRLFPWPLLLLLFLAACGSDGDDTQAGRAHVTVVAQAPGPTPFIRTLTLGIDQVADLASVAYTIAPKPGTHSKPVAVRYTRAWLERRNPGAAAERRLALPVFGLYANHGNTVGIDVAFADGSVHHAQLTMETPAHTAADAFYGMPTIRTARSAAPLPGLDFIEIHNRVTAPVVIDSDGNLRWTGTGLDDSLSTLFSANGFFVGSPDAPVLYRMELDGALSAIPLAAPGVTNFHHDFAIGKNGLLAELDAIDNGVADIEVVLAELSPSGQVIKQWNMAQIFRTYMLANGDDPSNFVRDGIDWFHMNSAIYSRADDALYVSSRENFVVKLDYETGRILWLLGDTSKHWHVDYPSLRALALRVAGGNPPIGQHALSLDDAGRLLLFNNGTPSFNHPADTAAGASIPYSAPVRYAIDEAARTATVVWTFEHERDIVSDICSSVFESASGTHLVTYSAAAARTHARLLGLDQLGQVAFDFDYPTTNCSTAFLAKPIAFDDLTVD